MALPKPYFSRMYFWKIVEIILNTQIPNSNLDFIKIAHRPTYIHNDFVCLCVCPSVTQMLDYWSVPLEFPRGQMSMTWLIGRHCDRRCLCSSDRPTDRASLVFFSEDRRIKPTGTVIAKSNSPQAARRQYTEEQALPSSLWVCGWVVGCVYVCVRRACVRGFVRPCVRALVDAIKKARAERAYA